MALPCDCCNVAAPPRCAFTSVPFDSAAQTVAVAGWNQVNINLTADGNTDGGPLSGYSSSPVGLDPTPTPEVTYTRATPLNNVRGIRLWNQHGGILNDSDGLRDFTADFYTGATLAATLNPTAGNGAAPFTFLFPGNAFLNGVDRVVLRNLTKQIPQSFQVPGWRELQLVVPGPVFACRRSNGQIEWYDLNGNIVPTADVVACADLI